MWRGSLQKARTSDGLRTGLFLSGIVLQTLTSTSAKDLGFIASYPGQVLLLMLVLPCLNMASNFLLAFFLFIFGLGFFWFLFFLRYDFVLAFWCDLLYSITITFLALMSLLPLSS